MTSPHDSQSAQRVISLIASATEILHALGCGHWQVARSHECDYPPSVLDLPQLTRAKFKVHGATSAEIDRSVKGLLEQGLAVYEVDADQLRGLQPDIILTQDQCEVCAVSLADVERALCDWTGGSAEILSLRPHTLSDVYADIRKVAATLGIAETGEALVAGMANVIADVTRATAGRPRPKLAFVEWIEPPMSGGHWMPELITAAGGISPFGVTGENSPWITWDEVAAADPDVILVAPCGYEISTSLAELRTLSGHPVWSHLRAVRAGQVFVADGNAFFNRPGPRLAESAQILGEILHPDVCGFSHRGTAFIPWSA